VKLGILGAVILLIFLTQACYGGTPTRDSITVRSPDKWLGNDKITHAVVCFTMAGFTVGTARTMLHNTKDGSFTIGISVPLGIGLLKEWYDMKHPKKHRASFKDLAADCIGAAIGAALTIAVTN
jgi:uncharacterized protein YfiM (DUF2279 family)